MQLAHLVAATVDLRLPCERLVLRRLGRDDVPVALEHEQDRATRSAGSSSSIWFASTPASVQLSTRL